MERWYRYEFDALNRITSGIDNTTDQRYSLTNVSYDKNGNIQNLIRNGHTAIDGNGVVTGYGIMDNLDYNYYPNSNQLQSVQELSGGNSTYGFKNGSTASTEYIYDANGNLTSDANKGITSVLYNHLNMPTKITVTGANAGVLDYVYSADGIKLRKIKTQGGVPTTTDYAGKYVYENNILKQFTHSIGYVEPDGNSYRYIYQYKDQIESVRLSYSDLDGNGSIDPATEILQERNNYPFGLQHKGYNNTIIGVENNYKTYQNQEINKEFGLNWLSYKYRNYDPAIGRFFNVDPLAEKYSYQSPYNFSENRVIDGIELEGLEHYNAGSTLMVRREMELAGASKEELAEYDRGVNENGSTMINMAIEEIPIIGELKLLFEGDFGGALLSMIPGAGFLKAGKKVSKNLKKIKTIEKKIDVKKVTSTKKKSDKVKTANNLEQAQNQLEGIEKAQKKAKKAKKGQKQNKIQSIKKSKQNLQNQLKRIDIDDLEN